MDRYSRSNAVAILGAAAVLGGVIGVGAATTDPQGRDALAGVANKAAIAAGMVRRRSPQLGDAWSGCDDARVAGTAPIYRGEPGYREGMDGDGDGIACEPVRH